MSLSLIEALLAQHIGLNVNAVGQARVAEAVERRMRAGSFAGIAGYTESLQHSSEELLALVDDVVVPETWFFRDTAPFRWLGQYAREQWRERRHLRVLSLPCASGEEPYSIAIQLMEAGLAPEQFQIEAFDISPRLLSEAERASYEAYSFRGVDERLLARYFDEQSGRYTVCEPVRERVSFYQGNIADPQFPKRLSAPYDVIFCRNLLIYFTPAARQCALDGLHHLLQAEGLLFLGHAEAGPAVWPWFVPHGELSSLAFRRRAEVTPKNVAAVAAVVKDAAGEEEMAHLQHIGSLVSQGHLFEAERLCQALIRVRPETEVAYYWLGCIREAQGRHHEAEGLFRKVIYLEPNHLPALTSLTDLAERHGDEPAAKRLRHRAGRVRARTTATDP